MVGYLIVKYYMPQALGKNPLSNDTCLCYNVFTKSQVGLKATVSHDIFLSFFLFIVVLRLKSQDAVHVYLSVSLNPPGPPATIMVLRASNLFKILHCVKPYNTNFDVPEREISFKNSETHDPSFFLRRNQNRIEFYTSNNQ